MDLSPIQIAARNYFSATTGISDVDAINLAFASPATEAACLSLMEKTFVGPFGLVGVADTTEGEHECKAIDGYLMALNEILELDLIALPGSNELISKGVEFALDTIKDQVRERIAAVSAHAGLIDEEIPTKDDFSPTDLLAEILGSLLSVAAQRREQASR